MPGTQEDKTAAIISYITWIGWIVAIIIHNNNKTEFGAFHLRQSLGLLLLALIFWFIPVLGWILNIAVFIFWLIGFIYAIQGEKKAVPLVGDLFQNIFSGIN
ncbi:MAG: hypothetical protein JW861_11025 [Bacteroidales bacterium]|nr:hypothetical protein [Bacteroidales bacterium]